MPDAPAPQAAPVDLRSTPSNNPFTAPVNADAQRLAAQPPKEPTRIAAREPSAFDQANMSPPERNRVAHGGEAAERYDPSKFSMQRDPKTGDTVFIDRATGKPADPTRDPSAIADPTAADTGDKFKIGEFEVSEQEIRDLMAAKSERDLARADIPATPADYKLELPTSADLPEGSAVALKNDPASAAMIEAAQAWAHKHNLSQAAFNDLVAIQARGVVVGQQHYDALKTANLAALGATGPQRIDGLVTWIRSQVGDVDAKPIIATMATAAHVKFFEKMQQKIMNPGGSNFTQKGRDDSPRGVDDATYNSWSYAEKKAYAENASRGGGRR